MILRLFLVLRSQCNCLNFAIVEIIRFITRSRSFVTGYYYIFRTMRFIKVSIIFFFFSLLKSSLNINEATRLNRIKNAITFQRKRFYFTNDIIESISLCNKHKKQTLFVKIERFEAIVILFDVMERERGRPGDGWRYEKGYIAKFNSRGVYLK